MALGLILKGALRRPGAAAQLAGRHLGRKASSAAAAVGGMPGITPERVGDLRQAVGAYQPGQGQMRDYMANQVMAAGRGIGNLGSGGAQQLSLPLYGQQTGVEGLKSSIMGGLQNVKQGIKDYGIQQQAAPLMSMRPGGGEIMGGLASSLGTLAMTQNPALAATVGVADIALSRGGARLAQQGLSSLGPYAAAAIPAAQLGTNLVSSIGVPMVAESLAGYGSNPQEQIIRQQLAMRPQAQMVGMAPNSMYQQQGMAY